MSSTILYTLKKSLLSMLDKQGEIEFYMLRTDLYNTNIQMFIDVMKNNNELMEIVKDLQSIFPDYKTSEKYETVEKLKLVQVKKYKEFFEKYKDKEDIIFFPLLELLKIN